MKDIKRFMEYIQEHMTLREKYSDIFPEDGQDDQWTSVPYANHAIRPWCVEEKCIECHSNATHKITETTGPANFHPLTAYVCCDCFYGRCNSYPYKNLG